MKQLNRSEIGARIRRLRVRAHLRQRDLADRLGATQSAIHKYEQGGLPEPARLLELARIGETTVEWILTGRHGDDGSTEQRRPSQELIETARLVGRVEQGHEKIDLALCLLHEVILALESTTILRNFGTARSVAAVRMHGVETLELFESAWRIQRALFSELARRTTRGLSQQGNRNDDRARRRHTPDTGSRWGRPGVEARTEAS